MGLMRVFGKSIRFTVRSRRRFIVFMLIFAIVSSFVAIFIDNIDRLQTDEFLDQKGVLLEEFSEYSVSYNQSNELKKQVNNLETTKSLDIDDSSMINFIDIVPGLRLFSLEVDKPWMSKDINPSFVQTGRFPRAENEVIIPTGSSQLTNVSNGVVLRTDLVIGQKIQFKIGDNKQDLLIVGTIDLSDVQIIPDKDDLWMFMGIKTYTNVIELFNLSLENSYTYTMSFTVPGLILLEETYNAVNQLKDEIENILNNDTIDEFGQWRPQPESLPLAKAKDEAKSMVTSLALAVIGGLLLSFFFSYLISRFRRREIAVLKALGYSNRAVRTSLIGEIITTAFIGFVLGLGVIQAFLFFPNFNFNTLLSLRAISWSFGINVLISLPGVVLVSFRILRVSPAEAFRDK